MLISPAQRITGSVELPGDKSISHRAAIIASMAAGSTTIGNFSDSRDCAATIRCLETLGVRVDRTGTDVIVHGVGKNGFRKPLQALDCENSGTTMRLLAGVLAGQEFESVLTGDASLRSRPMTRILEPLTRMGAAIGSEYGTAPLSIRGAYPLRPIDHICSVASAQVKSCVMLAALYAGGTSTVTEPAPTRDHTERMLRRFGVDVITRQTDIGSSVSLSGDQVPVARDLTVPGDISSAAFFMIAAACLSGSRLTLKRVGLNPTRTAIIEVLKNFGVGITAADTTEFANEPVGDLVVTGRSETGDLKKRNVISGPATALLIDEIPILAIFGTQSASGLEVRDAGELRVKESDRIRSIVENLRRMGAAVDEFDDGFRVHRSDLAAARIDPFGDHRIAMAFSIAGLLAKGQTSIINSECVDVSFPGFFEVLREISAAGG